MRSWKNKMLKWNTWLKQNSKRKLTGYLALGNPLGQHGRRIQHWHWIRCTLVRGLQSLWSSTENTHKSFKNKMRCVKMTTGHLCRWIRRVNRKNREHEPTRLLACFFKGDCFPFEWIESNTFHCLWSKFAQTTIQWRSWTIVKKSCKKQKKGKKVLRTCKKCYSRVASLDHIWKYFVVWNKRKLRETYEVKLLNLEQFHSPFKLSHEFCWLEGWWVLF